MDTAKKKEMNSCKAKPRFLIAAATSNSGKTTVTMGLLRALRNRGLQVQPFKCGPDYIDPMFHCMASGQESVNLDTFMSSEEHVRQLFSHYSNDADISIVEGVMGLYDGYDKSLGSSAEVAMLLDIPVILVVNAKSVAYSVAPLIFGFKNFNPRLRLAGVVFNMVASESHYSFLKAACHDAGVLCLGYLQRNDKLTIPGRHLGLTIKASAEVEQLISLAAAEVERTVDVDFLVKNIVNSAETVTQCQQNECHGNLYLVARDEAFNFTYRANIDALRRKGEVRFFSPLHDNDLPLHDIDEGTRYDNTILYLPGGYPELFAQQLADNQLMRESIRHYVEQGGRTYAECGGFMYLCHDIDGLPMCGVFPFRATMQGARLHLGYRKSGGFSGHEFHYSSVIEPEVMPDSIRVERSQKNAKGQDVATAIYHYRNVTAGYTHWYWADPSVNS